MTTIKLTIFILLLFCFSCFSVNAAAGPAPPNPSNPPDGIWRNGFSRNVDRLLLFKSQEITAIIDRILNGDPMFANIFNNTYNGRHGSVLKGIYQNAIIDNSLLPSSARTARAIAAKNKAFVYRTGIGVDQNGNLYSLSSAEREVFKNEALSLMSSFDVTTWSASQSRPTSSWDEFWFVINHSGEQYDLQYRARELVCYLQAYDMLRDIPGPLVWDDAIARRIIQFASNIYFMADIFADNYSHNNHRIITASALGVAAILFGDWGSTHTSWDRDSRSYKPYIWIGYAMSNIADVMFNYQVYDDGGYNEGPHYLKYGMTYALPFFKAMKIFGEVFMGNGDWQELYVNGHGGEFILRSPWYGRVGDQKPDYRSVFEWIAKIRQPEGRVPGIADTYNDTYFPQLSIIGEDFFWPVKSFDPNLNDYAMLNDELYGFMDSRVEFIVAGNLPEEPTGWDNFQVFDETGDIVMRSGWGLEDIYLHIYARNYAYSQSNYDLSSHLQHDNSSFLLGYKGQVLALDAGYVSNDNRDLVTNPQNHNLILINGQGPLNYQTTAQIIETFNEPFFKSARINTNYQSTNIKRHFLFIDETYFIINDQLDGNTSNSYTFLLHGNDHSPVQINQGAIWNISNAKLKAVVTSQSTNPTINLANYIHGDGYNQTLQHKTIEATKTAVDAQYLSVLFPYDANLGNEPDISEFSSADFAGVFTDRTINTVFGGRYDICVAQLNSASTIIVPEDQYGINNQNIKQIETDADLLTISFDSAHPNNSYYMKFYYQGMTSLKYDTEILYPNSAPQLTVIPDQSIDEATVVNIPIATSDPNNNNIILTVNNLPSFGSFVDNGNGSGSINLSPGYGDSGVFPNIEVIATDGGIPNMTDNTVFILTVNNVNLTPTAVVSSNIQSGTPPLSVQFSSSGSFDPDGSLAAYLWDFGDGTTSNEENPQHSFTMAGKFNVELTVTDNDGGFDSEIVEITSHANLNELYISEVSDANSIEVEYLEIYNNSSFAVDLNECKLIHPSELVEPFYIFDIGTDESYGNTSTIVPANGFLIIARGSTQSTFQNSWGNLAVNTNFNSGDPLLDYGGYPPKRWFLRYFDGTADTNNGSMIDDTQQSVGGSGYRSYQSNNGNWVTELFSTATPGQLDGDQSLPVELVSFTATGQYNSVLLRWETASELNNLGFVISRKLDTEDEYTDIVSFTTNEELKGLGNSPTGKNYLYYDRSVINGFTYLYKLIDVDISGRRTESESILITLQSTNNDLIQIGLEDIPNKFTLYPNFPNPFNGETTIQFDIPDFNNEYIKIHLIVHDILGRKIKDLYQGIVTPGRYWSRWDGANDMGESVPSGIYIYSIKSVQFSKSAKMILLQ